METQTAISLDSVIWAAILIPAAWFIFAEQRKKYGNLMSVLVGGIAVVGYAFLVVLFKGDIIKHIKISDTDKNIFFFLGWVASALLAAINAVIFSNRAKEQTKANQLVEKGHIQDRFKAATEHLGSEHPGMKIAAYHEFHQLAKDHKNDRDFCERIFEMLCAHLRQITNDPEYQKNHKNAPSEGVRTLLDLFFTVWSNQVFRNFRANLRHVYLVGADLSLAHLPRADFTDANLQRVKFDGVNLQGADFTRAKMHAATLDGVQMQKAQMRKTVLQFAKIRYTNMQNVYLSETDFRGAYLLFARMECSSWHSVDFRGARLEEIYLHQCDIERSQFGDCIDTDYPQKSFESRIMDRAGNGCDLNGCIVRGGMERKDIETTAKYIAEISESDADKYRAAMEGHIEIPEERLTEDECKRRNVQCESYTKEQADEWIAEYKEAMGDISDNQK